MCDQPHDQCREGPGWQALSGHKRSNTLAVELPPQARGTGTLIPSVRRLVLDRKAMTNLDSVLKSRDITLLTKVCIVKAMVFPMVTYSCESWTIKKAEHQRIDAFKLWCWRRLLKVP